jgi:cell division protein FtsA
VELDGVVLAALAAGHAVLSADERDLGALIIDLGGEETGAALFRGGGMLHAWALPVGGQHVSNDVAFGLRTSFAAADELKIRHGSTLARARPEGDAVPVRGMGGEERWIEQRTLADIIDARVSETFELVQTEMARGGFNDAYPAGVVVTGGSALLPGTSELAAEIFGVPARIGWPGDLEGLAAEVRSPALAVVIGLVAWGGEEIRAGEPTMASMPARMIAAIGAWLRDLFG